MISAPRSPAQRSARSVLPTAVQPVSTCSARPLAPDMSRSAADSGDKIGGSRRQGLRQRGAVAAISADDSDQGAADHDPVGERRDLRDVLAARNAETDRDRQLRMPP